MASDNVFGSGDLTPELLRGATFTQPADGTYDATEVREFLDRVASALETYMATDAASALRAEFRRNAEIAQQVLDAGQNAAAHVKQQAAEESRQILEETRRATAQMRAELEEELGRSREQVGAMRGALIQDLRDLYDRIGASLYRFERAVDEQQGAPIEEPQVTAAQPAAPAPEASAPEIEAVTEDDDIGQILPTAPQIIEHMEQEQQAEADAAHAEAAAAAPAPSPEPTPPAAPAGEQEVAATELPEGAKPPAWTQLPAEAYASPAPPTDDPFAVVEDEPLAPGEPLVDLRELQESAPYAAPAEQPLADAEPQAQPDPTPEPPAAEPAAESDPATSWLDQPVIEHTPDAERDDALAEMLIAAEPVQPAAQPATPEPEPDDGLGSDWLSTPDPTPPAAPQAATPAPGVPPPMPQPVEQPQAASDPLPASQDALETYQMIRDSIAMGQTRETVESYLQKEMGIVEPRSVVDAALGIQRPPGSA